MGDEVLIKRDRFHSGFFLLLRSAISSFIERYSQGRKKIFYSSLKRRNLQTEIGAVSSPSLSLSLPPFLKRERHDNCFSFSSLPSFYLQGVLEGPWGEDHLLMMVVEKRRGTPFVVQKGVLLLLLLQAVARLGGRRWRDISRRGKKRGIRQR